MLAFVEYLLKMKMIRISDYSKFMAPHLSSIVLLRAYNDLFMTEYVTINTHGLYPDLLSHSKLNI